MVRPAALYNKARFTRDIASLGRVVAALCGNPRIRREDLTDAELSSLEELANESEAMDKAVEAQRERWKERQRKARLSPDVTVTKRDTQLSPDVTLLPNNLPNNLPTELPTELPTYRTNNRSVTVPFRSVAAGGEPNGTEPNGNRNGTGSGEREVLLPGGTGNAKELARKFAAAARKDAGAFFDPQYDPVTVCAAVTGDFGSLKRWRQLVADKGEGAVREEAFAFWREVASGEDVANRGSALNARLAKLPRADRGGAAK